MSTALTALGRARASAFTHRTTATSANRLGIFRLGQVRKVQQIVISLWIHDDDVVGVDSFFDHDHLVVCRTDFHFDGLRFVAFERHAEIVAAIIDQSLHRDLQRVIKLLDEDLNLGRHSRSDVSRRLDDFDDRRVFFNRGKPVARFGVLVHLANDAIEHVIFKGAHLDFDRHAFGNERNLRLVDLGFDLHVRRVGQSDDLLPLANERAGLHHKLGRAASTTKPIGVHDLAVFRSVDNAQLKLLFDLG